MNSNTSERNLEQNIYNRANDIRSMLEKNLSLKIIQELKKVNI
jgi:sensor domain CHASE-containing protein